MVRRGRFFPDHGPGGTHLSAPHSRLSQPHDLARWLTTPPQHLSVTEIANHQNQKRLCHGSKVNQPTSSPTKKQIRLAFLSRRSSHRFFFIFQRTEKSSLILLNNCLSTETWTVFCFHQSNTCQKLISTS